MPSALGQPFIEAVMASLGEGVYAVGLDGRLTYINPAAEQLLGWSRSELQGREIHALVHAHAADGPCPCRVAMRAGSTATRDDDLFIVRGGRLIDVAWTAAPIIHGETIAGAVVTFRDVTEARASAASLRNEAQRNEVLVHVARDLSADLDIERIVQAVADAGVMLTRAAVGAFFYTTVNDAGDSSMHYAVAGVPREVFSGLSLPRTTAIFQPTFGGEGSVRYDDVTAAPHYGTMAPHHGLPEGHFRVRSYLAVPVLSRSGEPIGGLLFGHPEPAVFTDDDVRMVEGIAAHAAVVIDNARLFDREQKLAETLQRSLLPRQLPKLEGIGVATRYVPASGHAEVGGDWYDVIVLPNGNVAAVIGDVAGHSIHAATVMGQVRNALRGYALEGHPPATVMERANRFLLSAEPGEIVTCCYVELDREQGMATLVSAGHPPPVLGVPSQLAEAVEVAPGPPLGVDDDTTYDETTVLFPEQAVLVLYTDGLIERRDRSIDVGLAALIDGMTHLDLTDAELLADHVLVATGTAASPADDTAVLVLSIEPLAVGLRGHVVRRQLPCDPASPAAARRFVGDVLVEWDLDDMAETAQLLVSELVTNAVLHTATDLEVRLRVSDGQLRCEVVDGSTVSPVLAVHVDSDATSGRGLLLVELLAECWGVDDHATGKAVWFEMSTSASQPLGSALLGS